MGSFCSKCGKDISETGVCEECEGKKETPKFSNNGVINRALIKEEAKRRISNNMWNIWKPILVIMGISFMVSLVISCLISQESTLYYLLDLAFQIAVLPMSVGLALYMLNFVRNKKIDINDLFKYYDKRFLLILLVSILVVLFTFFWTLLFIIPGIVAALSYSMVNFIIAEGKKDDAVEVIKESKRMMNGYKWDYFVFNLSFIGWVLLCMFVIPLIYVLPYATVSQTLYYEELRKIKG